MMIDRRPSQLDRQITLHAWGCVYHFSSSSFFSTFYIVRFHEGCSLLPGSNGTVVQGHKGSVHYYTCSTSSQPRRGPVPYAA
jgi:hypothetical protein